MGFEVVPDDGKGSSGEARVRQVEPAAAWGEICYLDRERGVRVGMGWDRTGRGELAFRM
jgi:hypothetical protein